MMCPDPYTVIIFVTFKNKKNQSAFDLTDDFDLPQPVITSANVIFRKLSSIER